MLPSKRILFGRLPHKKHPSHSSFIFWSRRTIHTCSLVDLVLVVKSHLLWALSINTMYLMRSTLPLSISQTRSKLVFWSLTLSSTARRFMTCVPCLPRSILQQSTHNASLTNISSSGSSLYPLLISLRLSLKSRRKNCS